MQKNIGLRSDEEVQLNVSVPLDDKAFIKNLSDISNKSMSRILHEIIEQQKNVEESPNIYKAKNAPSFLFTNTATNEEIYSYLKENPSASRFIFKKYTANQSFIKELVDPENPIYLDGVANNLKEVYQIKEEMENVEKLRSERGNKNKWVCFQVSKKNMGIMAFILLWSRPICFYFPFFCLLFYPLFHYL